MLQYFNLQPGSKVLDLMCGYGRHAIALAKKGIEVTAIDNLEEYINEIKDTAEKEQSADKSYSGGYNSFSIQPIFLIWLFAWATASIFLMRLIQCLY